MRRRHLLLAGATAAITIAQPRRVRPATPADSTLRYVPNFSLPSLDPILGIPSSPHAYMVYDTLYGVDTAFVVRPQMAAGHVVEDEGRRWTIVLRDGLVFHDGEKVRAQDVVASIGRWMKRNTFGQKLQSATDELSAIDDRRIVFRLNRPFPLLLAALANPANPAFVLPERLARTDPYKPIQDATGSGPFRPLTNGTRPISLPQLASPASRRVQRSCTSIASSGASSQIRRRLPRPCSRARLTGIQTPRPNRSRRSDVTLQSRSYLEILPDLGPSCGSTTCIHRSTTEPFARRCCRPSSRTISCGLSRATIPARSRLIPACSRQACRLQPRPGWNR
jgi:hypothetical protein